MDYFYDGVLQGFFEVAHLLMVSLTAVSAANSLPACPPISLAGMQLLIMSLIALHTFSIVFVVIGAGNNTHSIK